MSTKDISRSALEGGRYNSWERNESHRQERTRAKVWLDSVRFNDEAAEDSNPEPRNHVNKGFTDKLNPCYRWLASKAGKPWAEVYGELSRKFDTRNLASWHIVNQHMLGDVFGAGRPNDSAVGLYRSHRFFIDDDGIFRDSGKYNRTIVHQPVYKGPSEASALAYARNRKVLDGRFDPNLKHWAMPNNAGEWRGCSRPSRCDIAKHLHRCVETTSNALIEKYSMAGWRSLGEGDWWRTYSTSHFVAKTWSRHKKFTKAEMAWWESLNWEIRRNLSVPK